MYWYGHPEERLKQQSWIPTALKSRRVAISEFILTSSRLPSRYRDVPWRAFVPYRLFYQRSSGMYKRKFLEVSTRLPWGRNSKCVRRALEAWNLWHRIRLWSLPWELNQGERLYKPVFTQALVYGFWQMNMMDNSSQRETFWEIAAVADNAPLGPPVMLVDTIYGLLELV